MPIYEYRCQSCGHELEVSQRISDAALTLCPACNKPALERLISRTSFQLKGGGWYKDLYSSPKNGTRSENDRIDRLSKAINDDKAKTGESTATAAASETSTPTAPSTPAPSTGGGSSEKAA